jgi:ABC-type oligopeptide transport system substrate-binding subunit
MRKLRQDGASDDYLSVSLGRSAELINGFEPDQQVAVRVLDDETVEIKLINVATD